MTDDIGDDLLDRLVHTARDRDPAPPAPLDAMWRNIEARSFPRRLANRWQHPAWWSAGIAAALVVGFLGGRISRPAVAGPAAADAAGVVAAAPRSPSTPYERTTSVLLGETVVLLSALPSAGGTPAIERGFATQASELLITTRLLLDSQAAANPALHDLLQDLELVLAQIARLHGGERSTELELITAALQDRDLVPRMRTLAAQLAASAD